VLACALTWILRRVRRGRPAWDAAVPRAQRILASAVHALLLLLLVAIPWSGWTALSALADSPAFGNTHIWFFGFDLRLAGYSARSGHAIGPDTLEPVIQEVLAYAKRMTAAQFLGAMSALNILRRQISTIYNTHDLWITPTTARVAEPWGRYHLGRTDLGFEDLVDGIMAPTTQFTLPHNVTGAPALSLPLAMHSQGLPIGVQLIAAPAQEHLLLQVGLQLEQAIPWADRVPQLHATRA